MFVWQNLIYMYKSLCYMNTIPPLWPIDLAPRVLIPDTLSQQKKQADGNKIENISLLDYFLI